MINTNIMELINAAEYAAPVCTPEKNRTAIKVQSIFKRGNQAFWIRVGNMVRYFTKDDILKVNTKDKCPTIVATDPIDGSITVVYYTEDKMAIVAIMRDSGTIDKYELDGSLSECLMACIAECVNTATSQKLYSGTIEVTAWTDPWKRGKIIDVCVNTEKEKTHTRVSVK